MSVGLLGNFPLFPLGPSERIQVLTTLSSITTYSWYISTGEFEYIHKLPPAL